MFSRLQFVVHGKINKADKAVVTEHTNFFSSWRRMPNVQKVHGMGETNSHKNDVIVESKRKIAFGCDPKTATKNIMRYVH